jgi:transcriptional regulator with XRE-family HTH domain
VARNPSKLRKVFAQHIRAKRRELGISQEELADRCGLHRTYVGAVERGERNISLDNMDRICTALGAQVPEMLTDQPAL